MNRRFMNFAMGALVVYFVLQNKDDVQDALAAAWQGIKTMWGLALPYIDSAPAALAWLVGVVTVVAVVLTWVLVLILLGCTIGVISNTIPEYIKMKTREAESRVDLNREMERYYETKRDRSHRLNSYRVALMKSKIDQGASKIELLDQEVLYLTMANSEFKQDIQKEYS